jgi:hypothetical protein
MEKLHCVAVSPEPIYLKVPGFPLLAFYMHFQEKEETLL